MKQDFKLSRLAESRKSYRNPNSPYSLLSASALPFTQENFGNYAIKSQKDFILHQPNPVPIRYYTQSKDNSKQHAISYTEENEWICIYVHIMQDHKTIACGYVMNFHSSMYACSIVT